MVAMVVEQHEDGEGDEEEVVVEKHSGRGRVGVELARTMELDNWCLVEQFNSTWSLSFMEEEEEDCLLG